MIYWRSALVFALLFRLDFVGWSRPSPAVSALGNVAFGPELWPDLFTNLAPLLAVQAMGSRPRPEVLASLAHHHADSIFVKRLCFGFAEDAEHNFESNHIFGT